MGRRETRRNEARSGARGARDVTYRGKRLGVGGSIGSSAWRCKREVTVCGRWPAGLYIDEEVAMADGSVLRQVRVPEGKTRPSRLRETCWRARASTTTVMQRAPTIAAARATDSLVACSEAERCIGDNGKHRVPSARRAVAARSLPALQVRPGRARRERCRA